MKKFTILFGILVLGGVYSPADAQTYGATVNQQQAINNASKIQSFANISKAMDTSQNNRITANKQSIDANEQNIGDNVTKLDKITVCNNNNKIYNPSSGSADGDGCVITAPAGNQTVYQCPSASTANGVSTGAWANYGCRGQIGLAHRCATVVFPHSQWRNCTPIGKVYMGPL